MATSQNSPRNLSDLLDLGTYQGMTDEEVEMVLDYKIGQALSESEYVERQRVNSENLSALLANGQETADRIADMIESMQGATPKIATYDAPKIFVPNSTGV